MRAIRIHSFSGPQVLTYEEAPVPEPAAGEVLIRVRAAGVNPMGWKVRQGMFGERRLPLIPGWDMSGASDYMQHASRTLSKRRMLSSM
ncbi:MAG: alcohol dehydrogenase catalytic domain-containing protein [Thermoleophilia bacterium]